MKGRLAARSLQNWVAQASFVFRGRIKALGKSNLDGVPPDDRMATVEVKEVVVAPPDLGDLTGKTITVYLTTRQGLRTGSQATFFARNWHVGSSIGVVEVGRTSAPVTEVRQAVGDTQLQQMDAQLEERLRVARLIVSAKVLSVSRVDDDDMPGIDDGVHYEWVAVPKCQPDQEGVWLLRTIDEVRKPKRGARKPAKRAERSEEYW